MTTSRSATAACLTDSSPRSPCCASTVVITRSSSKWCFTTGSREQRVEDRRRIGEARGLDDDAAERGDLARGRAATSRSRSSSARSPRRVQQTQPFPSSTVRSSTRRSRWWSIADLAELVDDHRRLAHLGVGEQPGEQRRLAAAEEAGERGRRGVFTTAPRRGRDRAGRAARPQSRSASTQTRAEVVDDGRCGPSRSRST